MKQKQDERIQWFYRCVDDSSKYQLLKSYIAEAELKFSEWFRVM